MPSESLKRWRAARQEALDEIEAAHRAVGGSGPGRRYATQQINQAYAAMLSSQFQGYCRDLHTEAVDHVCRPAVGAALPADPRLVLLRLRLTTGRKLDTGNPNPGNLGADFGFFDLDLWPSLKTHDAANAARQKQLTEFAEWRNAIAHQNFDKAKLGGRDTVRLRDVRRWRTLCGRLAENLDSVIRAHVATITGRTPW
jgi:hypothetical protein